MFNGISSLLKQHGREAVRGAGQAMLYSNVEPIDAWHEAAVAFRGASVPRKLLAERVVDFEDLVIQPLAPSPALGHLERYLSILINEEVGADPALEQHVGGTLIDLIALSLGASGDSAVLARMRGLRAARLQAIVKEILQGFSDLAFSPEAVARRLGLSPRYVRDLLHESGVGFTERVLDCACSKRALRWRVRSATASRLARSRWLAVSTKSRTLTVASVAGSGPRRRSSAGGIGQSRRGSNESAMPYTLEIKQGAAYHEARV
jgi:AraC-like DNA-binding protein